MRKFIVYSGLVAGTLFIGIGIFLIVYPPPPEIPGTASPMPWLGYLVGMYGIFRLGRGIIGFRRMRAEANNPQ
jgi:hypothetical protein